MWIRFSKRVDTDSGCAACISTLFLIVISIILFRFVFS